MSLSFPDLISNLDSNWLIVNAEMLQLVPVPASIVTCFTRSFVVLKISTEPCSEALSHVNSYESLLSSFKSIITPSAGEFRYMPDIGIVMSVL